MNQYEKIYKYTMASLLSLFIGGMFSINLLTPNKSFSDSENRNLEPLPTFSIQNLLDKKFTSHYETYMSDQFAFRDFWIGMKSDIDRTIGKKENNGVYIGKNGFLLQKFNKPEDQDVKSKIAAINDFHLANPNVEKHIMLIPTAISILDKKLPNFVSHDDELTYIDKVKKSLNTKINFIDVYPTLRSKENEYIYYKTDHHWTTKGAYYAYLELSKNLNFTPTQKESFNIKKITNSFYGSLYSKGGFRHIDPDSIELYEPKEAIKYKVEYVDEDKTSSTLYEMNNIKKKDKYTVFFNGNHPLVKITTENTSEKKIVVVKDSYANALLPFLLPHFSEIQVIDLRYYSDSLHLFIQKNKIDEMLLIYNANTFFEDSSISDLSE
ncbi:MULTISPECIES: DHHW family protein [Lysinibacillus]|uniref:DHHW family protein n=1 Tax=Lysinibacillus TaxID=400634 RepID=UPI002580512B|nr:MULTISPECIES: DHHW family protein [Lysinibacillus]